MPYMHLIQWNVCVGREPLHVGLSMSGPCLKPSTDIGGPKTLFSHTQFSAGILYQQYLDETDQIGRGCELTKYI